MIGRLAEVFVTLDEEQKALILYWNICKMEK
jgi:hypothetical protein